MRTVGPKPIKLVTPDEPLTTGRKIQPIAAKFAPKNVANPRDVSTGSF